MNHYLDKYQYFIFDFDGVIIQSNEIKVDAFRELFADQDEQVLSKILHHHVSNGGISRFEKLKYYYSNYLNQTLSSEELSMLGSRFSDIVLNKIIEAEYVEGILDFLKKISSLNKSSFIISGTPQEELELIVNKRQLSKYFKKVLGSPLSKDTHIKDLIERGLIDTSKSIYFGDSKEDYLAAVNNRIDYLMIENDQSRLLDLKTYSIKSFN